MLLERKVTASSTLALVAGVILAVLNAMLGNSQLLGSLPAGVQGVIVALAPALLTLAAGVAAPHTARPDLAPTQSSSAPLASAPIAEIPPVDAPNEGA